MGTGTQDREQPWLPDMGNHSFQSLRATEGTRCGPLGCWRVRNMEKVVSLSPPAHHLETFPSSQGSSYKTWLPGNSEPQSASRVPWPVTESFESGWNLKPIRWEVQEAVILGHTYVLDSQQNRKQNSHLVEKSHRNSVDRGIWRQRQHCSNSQQASGKGMTVKSVVYFSPYICFFATRHFIPTWGCSSIVEGFSSMGKAHI